MRQEILVGLIMAVILVCLSFAKAAAMENHGVKAVANDSDGQDMALNKKIHGAQPWKVHEIAKDFDLLDVWEIPILADARKNQDFRFFLEVMKKAPRNPMRKNISAGFVISAVLVLLRHLMGDIFPLDKDINTLPIPGCKETSLRERLSEEDLARSLAKKAPEGEDKRRFAFRVVYLYENELLNELSNNTVHVLMHLGWVHKYGDFYTAQLAVYVKPRNLLGRLYMKLIMPFRRSIIYPTMARNYKYRWEAYCSGKEKEKETKEKEEKGQPEGDREKKKQEQKKSSQ